MTGTQAGHPPATPTDRPALRSLADVVARHARTLDTAGVPTPRVDAEVLASHVTGLRRTALTTAPLPGPDTLARLEALVARRADREPLQLVIGRTWFRELTLACRPGVFIPRPETEIVTGLAIDAARRGPAPRTVVDIGTGTGAIALSVTAEVPGARVVATDASAAAVDLARANLATLVAGRAGVPGVASGASCEIRHGALLDPVAELAGRIDVLVSNPPYLPAADRGSWEPEVAGHDPDEALVGGDDGHEVVDALLAAAGSWLVPGGTVVVEIDERRGTDALAHATGAGLVDARIETDLTGAVRALVARRPGEEARS